MKEIKMVIKTFKDIKDVLKEIPDKILDKLYFGLGEGREENIGIVAPEGKNGFPEIFDKIDKKYPELNEVFKLIENIQEVQQILDNQNDTTFDDEIWEEGISSDTHFGIKDELSDLVKQKLKKQGRKMTNRRKCDFSVK